MLELCMGTKWSYEKSAVSIYSLIKFLITINAALICFRENRMNLNLITVIVGESSIFINETKATVNQNEERYISKDIFK